MSRERRCSAKRVEPTPMLGFGESPLSIYLNDHLAGATAGVEPLLLDAADEALG